MGERALAAVRCGGQVDCYRAQWAGSDDRLARVLGTGGRRSATEARLDALAAVDWQYRGRVSAGAFPRHVDALELDAVYLVSTRGVAVYLPVWPGFSPPTAPTTGDGVLVRVETAAECRRLRATVRFLKDLLHEGIALALLDAPTARSLLALALRLYCHPTRIETPETLLER